jgi:hypothetical protein
MDVHPRPDYRNTEPVPIPTKVADRPASPPIMPRLFWNGVVIGLSLTALLVWLASAAIKALH